MKTRPMIGVSVLMSAKKPTRFVSIAFLLFCGLLSCSPITGKKPLPVNGVLDTREWDFEKDGNIIANGYWEFYFGSFLSDRQFDTLSEKYFTWVPGVWKGVYFPGNQFDTLKERRFHLPNLPWMNNTWQGEKLGGTGYASYRLTIILPKGQKELAFKIRQIGTAYSFFVNDSLVTSCGIVGATAKSSCPQQESRTTVVENLKDTTRLTLWISNFHYRKGGPWNAIEIGDPGILIKQNQVQTSFLLFTVGVWFMVSFVLMSFLIYRPKEKSILFLLLWALSILVRIITSDERIIIAYFPQLSFEWLIKLSQLSSAAMAPFACMALYYLFPAEFSKWFVKTLMVIFLVLFIFILVTKAIFYSYLLVPYTIICILAMAYASFLMIKAMIHRREGAVIITIGMILALSLYLLQGFYYVQVTTFQLGSPGHSIGFIIAIAQVLLLARIFSSALNRIEHFAGEMETTIELRTRELIRMQEQLILAAKQAETEKIRMRISQDIHDDISSGLNKITWLSEMVKIKAMKNKVEEVNVMLDKILKISRESVDHLIEIIWSLNPHSDDLEGLFAYMRNYINRFFDDTSFNVTINFPEHTERININPELKRNLFLVMKEALNNAAKYSEAHNIRLDFKVEELSYTFIISDDGVGFEEGEVRGTGHGMTNIRKRMEDINGRLTVISSHGQGTRIIMEGFIY